MAKLSTIHRGDDGFTDFKNRREPKSSASVGLLAELDRLDAELCLWHIERRDVDPKDQSLQLAREVIAYVQGLITGYAPNEAPGAALLGQLESYLEANEMQFEGFIDFSACSALAARGNICRTTCRVVEHQYAKSMQHGDMPLKLLNRLSDYLFLCAAQC